MPKLSQHNWIAPRGKNPRGVLIDLKGVRFGRLVVIKQSETVRYNNQTSPTWLCRCDCGGELITKGQSLREGRTQSCGCLRLEDMRIRRKTHGHSSRDSGKGGHSAEYRAWCAMKGRCSQPSAAMWHRYGGRGIRVCDRWLSSFEAFFADMGAKPTPNHSLDRIDFDGDYEPTNCRWATRKEQNRNRSDVLQYTFDGLTLTLPEWAERTGIDAATLRTRIKAKWSIEKALTREVGRWVAPRAERRQ